MEQNMNERANWQSLFKLYQDLVGPFREFENRASHKRGLEWEASNAKGTIDNGYSGTIRNAFSHTLKWTIPSLIVFWVAMFVVHVNGENLMHYYNPLMSELIWAIEDLLSTDGSIIFEFGAFFIAIPLLICLIFVFSLMIVSCVIPRTRKISKAKRTLKACEKQLPQAEAATREALGRIAPYANKIPPNYRNSQALAFFANSYFNFKVNNLQEAINLYDQYLHQQRMEQGQREMAMAQQDAMNDISRQLDHMEDLINSQEIVVNNYYYH